MQAEASAAARRIFGRGGFIVMQFTPSQKLAAELAGDSLTVSAAAGSGKTAVLVARVTERLCDKSKQCYA